ncbi:MAG: type II 3-dehydroquinate dehydratase [Ignavibacteriaceae bacterium]
MKILVINGPNLNMLGSRDKEKYGSLTLKDIEDKIISEYKSHSFEFFQSNLEGELVSKIQTAIDHFDGIIINPGGYAHTSVAIKDALTDCSLPKIEVHLSHLANREDFRQVLLTASSCDGYVSGFKENSYLSGVYLLERIFNKE